MTCKTLSHNTITMHHKIETPFTSPSNALWFLLACLLWLAVILLAAEAV